MKQFWICFVQFSQGGNHYQHYTFESAKTEAERLALLPGNEGRNVYVMLCVGAVVKPPAVTWISIDNGIPF